MIEYELPQPQTWEMRKLIIDAGRIRAQKELEDELAGKEIWGGPTTWGIIESPLYRHSRSDQAVRRVKTYQSSFKDVLPPGHKGIRDYIETTLASDRGNAIGLELGGTGTRMFSDFTPGFFQRTAGINLTDYRAQIDTSLFTLGEEINHIVIPGDLTTNETKQKVINFLDGQKANLIIERMEGGHEALPQEPDFLGKQFNYWYRLLAENGLMFIEPPAVTKPFIPRWIHMIQNQFADTIEAEYFMFYPEALRIRKLPGAPEELPLVDNKAAFREILKSSK